MEFEDLAGIKCESPKCDDCEDRIPRLPPPSPNNIKYKKISMQKYLFAGDVQIQRSQLAVKANLQNEITASPLRNHQF